MQRRVPHRLIVALFASVFVCASGTALAQVPKAGAKAPAGKAAQPKIPDPEDVTLETKDGVNIRATWYAGLGKKASVPIIMLHGWEGQRGDYDLLARFLQQQRGHSIIVPDLRGHGDSTVRKLPNGDTRRIEASSLTRADLEAMALDVEACKKFLLQKHNAGELNIEMLCVVAADFSCIVALRWTAMDWRAPRLPALKQGQDVQAVVLLSPLRSHKGLTLRDAMSEPAIRKTISVLMVAGAEDRRGTTEAKALLTPLESQRPKPSADDPEKQDLVFIQPKTSLSGTALLGPGLNVGGIIGQFIDYRLERRQAEFPWSERRSPL